MRRVATSDAVSSVTMNFKFWRCSLDQMCWLTFSFVGYFMGMPNKAGCASSHLYWFAFRGMPNKAYCA